MWQSIIKLVAGVIMLKLRTDVLLFHIKYADETKILPFPDNTVILAQKVSKCLYTLMELLTFPSVVMMYEPFASSGNKFCVLLYVT